MTSTPAHKLNLHLAYIVIAIIVIFTAVRFINIDADFPLSVSQSGVLYTDEGWYSNGAVRDYISGDWYRDGDFNPAVNMPVGQILNRISFAIFGLHISSARFTSAIAFSLIILLSTLLARKHFGTGAGIATGLVMATNFTGFAYSRLAIMEPVGMAFVLASIFIIDTKKGITNVILSGIVLGLAILTKTSMIFAIPILAYMAFRNGQERNEKILFSLISVLACLAMFRGYETFANHFYHVDFSYFNRINIANRIVPDLPVLLMHVKQISLLLMENEKFLLLVFFLSVPTALLASERYRKDTLTHVMLGYALVYFSMISLVIYGPPRYLLPLEIPLSILTASAIIEISRITLLKGRKSASILATFLLLLIITPNVSSITRYMIHLQYTYKDMMLGIKEIFQEREKDFSDIVLMGGMADSVSLETGVRTVNVLMGTKNLSWRIRRFKPNYLVWFGEGKDREKIIENTVEGKITILGQWDVYGNYYVGYPISLYGIEWASAPESHNQ